jgi:hypothetical protein
VGTEANWSANTDPQAQEAASPQVLRSGCLQRWPARHVLPMFAHTVAVALVCSLLASCGGGGGGGGGGDAPPPAASVFVLRMRGLPASEEFRVTTSSAQVIAQARGQLVLPEAQRRLFASGAIRPGDGGHNTGWSWHVANVSLVEAAIELCDGRPSMVEANLDYWLNTVGRFCPWSSYVYAEVE